MSTKIISLDCSFRYRVRLWRERESLPNVRPSNQSLIISNAVPTSGRVAGGAGGIALDNFPVHAAIVGALARLQDVPSRFELRKRPNRRPTL